MYEHDFDVGGSESKEALMDRMAEISGSSWRDGFDPAVARTRNSVGVQVCFSNAEVASLLVPGSTITAGPPDVLPTDLAASDRLSMSPLTRREREILMLLCERLTDAEIAQRLAISRRTVSSHVSSILGKLGATNRRRASAIAIRNALI